MPDGLTQDYLEKLHAWACETQWRSVTITIQRNYKQELTCVVHCYDGELKCSDFPVPPAMPDIPARLRERELKQLEELQAKYQGVGKYE